MPTSAPASRPALRVDNLLPDRPEATEFELRTLCAQHGCAGRRLLRVAVPTHDKKQGRDGKKLGRGFAFLTFRDAASATFALAQLEGRRLGSAVLRVSWDGKAPTLAASPQVAVAEPAPMTQVEYPTLPAAAPARAPVLVTRPAPRPAAEPAAERESDTASVASAATTVRAVRCGYCKEGGHGVQLCPALARRRCQVCGCLGHTESRCAHRIAEEAEAQAWRAQVAASERRKERQADRALARHEEEVSGWRTVGARRVTAETAEAAEAAEAAPQAAEAQPRGANRPSRAQRQAAKRVAAKAAAAA